MSAVANSNPDDAARSTTITFKNHTDAYLSLSEAHLDHGIWSENKYPPQHVDAGASTQPTTVVFAAESQGSTTGDEGYATYLFQDGQSKIKLYFDNPWWGGNKYSVTITGPLADTYDGSYSGGSGNNASVTFELRLKNA